MTTPTKVKIVCSKCGSANVVRDAYAEWDIETQSYVLRATYDSFTCEGKCDGDNDAEVDEIPVDHLPVVDGDDNADIYGWAGTIEEAAEIAKVNFVDPVARIECYGPIKLAPGEGWSRALNEGEPEIVEKAWVVITEGNANAQP